MRIDRFLFVLMLRASGVVVFAQDPFHRNYTVEDGLPSNQVYCATQDHEGYMWFGTDAGVSRFDGVEFINFGPADGLSDNEVIGIHEDSSGRLWFLTLNGRLCYLHAGKWHNGSTDPALASHRAGSGWSTFCEDRQGRLWFGGVTGERLRLDLSGRSPPIITRIAMKVSMVRDPSGNVLSVSGELIERFDEEGFETVFVDTSEAWSANHVAQPYASNTAPVVLRRTSVAEVTVNGPVPVEGTQGLIDRRIHRCAVRDQNGDLWIFRMDLGVDKLASSKDGPCVIEHQFGTEKINSMFITPEGDQWFCTANHGVFLVDRQAQGSTAWFHDDRSPGSVYISIAEGGGRWWLGTDRGGIHTFRNGHLERTFEPGEGRMPGRVLRIVPDGRERVWFGTDWGLFRWYGGKSDHLDRIPLYNSRASTWRQGLSPAKSVLVAKDGKIWSPGMGLWINAVNRGQETRELYLVDKLPMRRLNAIAEDSTGVIWLSDEAALITVRGDSVSRYSLPEDLSSARILDIVACGGDTLALATSGHGVLFWAGDRVIGEIGVKDGLASSVVRRARLRGDTLWCCTPKGLTAIRMRKGVAVKAWTWDMGIGLPTNSVFDVHVAHDRLYMATAMGLCISPHHPPIAVRPPPTLKLAHLFIDQKDLAASALPLTIGTEDRVQLDVHALEFANAGQVEYVFSTDTAKGWFACSKGQVVLNGLDEGDHLIMVKARFPAGAWSSSYGIPLLARPSFWSSRIVKGAIVMGVMSLLFFGIYYWSRLRFQRKLGIARALAVVHEERRRIAADVHDDLGADLSRVLMHARQLESVTGKAGDGRVSRGLAATINKIDEIIWSLDPQRDTLRSTISFIEQQAREMAESSGLSFRTEVKLPEADVPLTAMARREVMLIAREALRNVVKHAHASTLRIVWRVEGDVLTMIVQDDGSGIHPLARAQDRRGLGNMRERAARLRGDLSIGPAEPHGTKVELRMELRSNHPIG